MTESRASELRNHKIFQTRTTPARPSLEQIHAERTRADDHAWRARIFAADEPKRKRPSRRTRSNAAAGGSGSNAAVQKEPMDGSSASRPTERKSINSILGARRGSTSKARAEQEAKGDSEVGDSDAHSAASQRSHNPLNYTAKQIIEVIMLGVTDLDIDSLAAMKTQFEMNKKLRNLQISYHAMLLEIRNSISAAVGTPERSREEFVAALEAQEAHLRGSSAVVDAMMEQVNEGQLAWLQDYIDNAE